MSLDMLAAEADEPDSSEPLAEMRAAGVLEHVDGHKFNARDGVIVVGCGDCDRRDGYTTYLSRAVHKRLHFVMLNGGPLAISELSELHWCTSLDSIRHSVGQVIISQVLEAAAIKQIAQVALVAHWPCGAAKAVRMNLHDVLLVLIDGKRKLKEVDPGLEARCFLSVHKNGHGERTYFVNRARAEAWLRRA